MNVKTPKKIRALVIGHTGATGKALLDALIASPECESIVAIGRRESQVHKGSPKLTQIVLADMKSIASLDPALAQQANAAFCCIGTPFNDVFFKKDDAFRAVDFVIATEFAKYAKAAGADFFATITGEGTDPDSKMNMTRVKGEVEVLVRSLRFSRVAFLRPGFLNRGRDAGWLEKIMSLGGILGLPVSQLARAMAWAALHQKEAEAGYTTKDVKRVAPNP